MLKLLLFFISLLSLFFYDYYNIYNTEQKQKTPNNISVKYGKLYNYKLEDINLTYKLLSPKKIVSLDNEKILYDFGKVFFGGLKITNLSRNIIKLKSIDILEKFPFKIKEMNKRSIGHYTFNNIKIKDSCLLSTITNKLPKKENLPFGLQGVLPFRYVLLDKSIDVKKLKIEQVAVFYPANWEASSFASSDKNLNKLFNLTKHTIQATSFAGIFVDGYREILPYEADSYFAMLCQYSLNKDYLIARKSLLYHLENPSWPFEWPLFSIAMAKQDYIRTGDKDFLKAIYQELKKRVFLDRIKLDGFFDIDNLYIKNIKLRPIVDWPVYERRNYAKKNDNSSYIEYIKYYAMQIREYMLLMYGFNKLSWVQSIQKEKQYNKLHEINNNNLVVYAHLYNALNNMYYLSSELNLIKDANLYEAKMVQIKNYIQNNFFDMDSKLYFDTIKKENISFQSNLFALAYNIVPQRKKNKVLQYVIKHENEASTYTSYFLLKVLYDNHLEKQALKYMTKNDNRSWIGMIENYNATITMESWNTKVKPNLDFTHVWSATPLIYIYKYIVGINYMDIDKLTLFPHLDGLKYISGKVETPLGNIIYNYKRLSKKVIEYKIVKDFSSVIFFNFNKNNIKSIIFNGKEILNLNNNFIKLDNKENIIVIKNNNKIGNN